jgi:putative hydrolase of the HAD superfamily
MANIEHIFFDLDHTLWDYDKNSENALDELYVLYSLDQLGLIPKSRFIESFHKANLTVWNLFDENQVNRDELRNKRMELVYEEFNLNLFPPDGFHKAYYTICSKGKHLIPGTMDILHWLEAKYKLHIITNGFEDSQHNKLQNSGIANFFETVTTSERAKCKKPDPAYFEFALNQAGAKVGNSLVIGDGLRTDIAGARKFGLPVIWYNPDKAISPFEDLVFVTSLNDLKNKL